VLNTIYKSDGCGVHRRSGKFIDGRRNLNQTPVRWERLGEIGQHHPRVPHRRQPRSRFTTFACRNSFTPIWYFNSNPETQNFGILDLPNGMDEKGGALQEDNFLKLGEPAATGEGQQKWVARNGSNKYVEDPQRQHVEIPNAKNFVAEKIGNMAKPEAEVTDVDFKKVSLSSVEYLAKVSVTNPYSHSIPICDIKYTLKSVNREIASGTIPDPGSIRASDVTVLEVLLKVPHSILLTLVKDLGADWDFDYELDIGLIIDLPVIGNFTIPLNKKGEFKLPSLF
ncbi:hypothetical protein DVH24_014192, partial [Malus domestica]